MKLKKELCALLLGAAILLSGCSGGGVSEATSTPTSSSDTPEVTSDTPAETGESAPDDTPDSVRHYEKLGDSGLEYIADLLFEPMTVSNISDGQLLTIGCDENGKSIAALINVSDGSAVSVDCEDINLEYNYLNTTFILNGFPVIIDSINGTVYVYDRSMKLIGSSDIGRAMDFRVQTDENTLVCNNYEEDKLLFVTIGADGSVSVKEEPINNGEYHMYEYKGQVHEGEHLLSFIDNDTGNIIYFIYKQSDGSFEKLRTDPYEYALTINGKIIFRYFDNDYIRVFDPELPDVVKTINVPMDAYIPTHSYGCSYLYSYLSPYVSEDGSTLTIYCHDLDNGRLVSKTEAKLSDGLPYSVTESGGKPYINIFDDIGQKIATWETQESAAEYGYNAVAGKDFYSENMALARKIREQYNIDVLYGEDGVRYFNDYAAVAETDEQLIYYTLTTLDGFFGKFPDGFFLELITKTDDYNKMSIYLTGKIIPNLNESQSISDAAAFVFTENSEQIMVVDITQTWELEKTVAHEFMHIIENAMYDLNYSGGVWRDLEMFARWEMLNPDGFSYYYTYTDEYGFTMGYDAENVGSAYYEGCGIDVDTIYFVDGYSMTFPNEDRARIFENIATCTPESLPAYFKGEHMQLKAAYLSACIRECFDSITDDATMFWEHNIDPKYTMEYFKENYDLESYWADYAVG